MNKEEIKIITLGDIFDNIETEEKAFKFKDYIKDLQQKVEQQEKEIDRLSKKYENAVADYETQKYEVNRLNNIINELEKYLEEESKYDEYKDVFYRENMGYVLDKLKKLKEDNNEVNKQVDE